MSRGRQCSDFPVVLILVLLVLILDDVNSLFGRFRSKKDSLRFHVSNKRGSDSSVDSPARTSFILAFHPAARVQIPAHKLHFFMI